MMVYSRDKYIPILYVPKLRLAIYVLILIRIIQAVSIACICVFIIEHVNM